MTTGPGNCLWIWSVTLADLDMIKLNRSRKMKIKGIRTWEEIVNQVLAVLNSNMFLFYYSEISFCPYVGAEEEESFGAPLGNNALRGGFYYLQATACFQFLAVRFFGCLGRAGWCHVWPIAVSLSFLSVFVFSP